ncbi:hypothetical protein MIND_00636100 [Mycena indigotica]|uniref:Uncharacterized protein n=1 Tax=Mycena indigotica TaxID=2126181 RepID=A0A8H6SQN2_9AGAR|nr:uncharacterized protein MIND_00636100 [Mycena indigotica]KAF7304048.1 hypothetical protein MIND_00636100 [Mycena indigotica]
MPAVRTASDDKFSALQPVRMGPTHNLAHRASIRVLAAEGVSHRALASAFGGSVSTIRRVISNCHSSRSIDNTAEDHDIAHREGLLAFNKLWKVTQNSNWQATRNLKKSQPEVVLTKRMEKEPEKQVAVAASQVRVAMETDSGARVSSNQSEAGAPLAVAGPSKVPSNPPSPPDFLRTFLTRIGCPELHAPLAGANFGREDLLRLARAGVDDALRYAYMEQLAARLNLPEFGVAQCVWLVENIKQLKVDEDSE